MISRIALLALTLAVGLVVECAAFRADVNAGATLQDGTGYSAALDVNQRYESYSEEFSDRAYTRARVPLADRVSRGNALIDIQSQAQSHLRGLAAAQEAAGTWTSAPKDLSAAQKLGEVSAGVLSIGVKPYLLVVGQAPKDSGNEATMIYDFAADSWIAASPRPYVGNHHASEVINNELYLFGGLSEGHSTVQIATLVEGAGGVDVTWRLSEDVPIPTGSAATAYIGGLVYYCGGIDESNTFTVPNCFTYDPETETWSQEGDIPDMPEARNHAAACTDGTSMYIFGGRDGKNVVGPGFPETQIYTPGVGWKMGTPLPLARGGMGKGVFWGGECFVFGGEVNEAVPVNPGQGVTSKRVVTRVDVYDIATDSWREATRMTTGLHGIFPVEHDGIVYIAAGGEEAAYSQSTLHLAFKLPPAEPEPVAPPPVNATTTTVPPPVPAAPEPVPAPDPVPLPMPVPEPTPKPVTPENATIASGSTGGDTESTSTASTDSTGEVGNDVSTSGTDTDATSRSVTTLDGTNPSGTPQSTPEPVSPSPVPQMSAESQGGSGEPVATEASGALGYGSGLLWLASLAASLMLISH